MALYFEFTQLYGHGPNWPRFDETVDGNGLNRQQIVKRKVARFRSPEKFQICKCCKPDRFLKLSVKNPIPQANLSFNTHFDQTTTIALPINYK